MSIIVNPTQIPKLCRKITCGQDQGTGFFVTENLVMTGYHVVLNAVINESPIKLLHDGNSFDCTIDDIDEANDVCLLKVESPNADFAPLKAHTPVIGEPATVFGFPYAGQDQGLLVQGSVTRIITDNASDFMVGSPAGLDSHFQYDGLSGAPVISDSHVIGIVLRQVDTSIAAVSIRKIAELFQKKDITVLPETFAHETPDPLSEQLDAATPNTPVLTEIAATLKTKGNWFLLYGSPGSGKSTLAAAFKPDLADGEILGRYFVKVPGDREPISLRTSRLFFLDTLENIVSLKLYQLPHARETITFEERVARIPEYLIQLNSYLVKHNKYGVLILDGLDEIPDLVNFLQILPVNLPSNIKVLLSCTTKQILPVQVRTLIGHDQTVEVTPLNLVQCEEFIKEKLVGRPIAREQLTILAKKSEGHPLYLNYLINYLLQLDAAVSEEAIGEWISKIPIIGGHISKYYETLWSSIAATPDKLWLTVILGQLRQPVAKTELYGMLPESYKLTFESYLPTIASLLRMDDKIEIYHNSFKNFIEEKTPLYISQANDHISAFCKANPDIEFSFTNNLFHLAKSSNPADAVKSCNQQWADQCTLNDVEPDLVLDDIRRIIDLSIDLLQTTELIRLLLLIQRIQFRYDSVFADNANCVVAALISLKKYKASLKYLVRDNTLLVTDSESIVFLQSYFENNAFEEATALYNAINTKFHRTLKDSIGDSEGISISLFTSKAKADILLFNHGSEIASGQLTRTITLIRNLIDDMEGAGDSETAQSLHSLLAYISAWFNGYLLRNKNAYLTLDEYIEKSGLEPNADRTLELATALNCFNELNDYNMLYKPKTDKYFSVIRDIERSISGYEVFTDPLPLRVQLMSLMQDSKDTIQVSKLMTEYLKSAVEQNLRMPNGVDLNYQSVFELIFEFMFKGYLDESNAYPPTLGKHHWRVDWEDYFLSLFKYLSFLEGRLYRLKATGEDMAEDLKRLSQFTKLITFSLADRQLWKRSYAVPEALVPMLFDRYVLVAGTFNSTLFNDLKTFVEEKSPDQLGLYTEGFRESLHMMIKRLLMSNADKAIILSITQIWRRHVLIGVQNRWERTPELLKITEIYGLTGEQAAAESVFKDTLATSMGPTWYKEETFSLINTLLDCKRIDKDVSEFIQQFAGIMDFGSGEMTFQRYARNDKENFVGSINRQLGLQKAVDYFKFELVPPPDILNFNAEHFKTDMAILGNGYALGARNIAEYSAARGLLEADISPVIAWGLCTIFVVSDDTYRYIYAYGKRLAKAINAVKAVETDFFPAVLEYTARLVADPELNEDRSSLLNYMAETLEPNIIKDLKTALSIVKIAWEPSPPERSSEAVGPLAEFNDLINTKRDSYTPDLIEKGVKAFEIERISIWWSNISSASKLAFKNLKKIIQYDHQALPHLKSVIKPYSGEYWVVADKILDLLGHSLSSEQLQQIYAIIVEHFDLIVRPEKIFIDKYKWMPGAIKDQEDDLVAIDLMIWLLSFPDRTVAGRAKAVIQFLLDQRYSKLIKGLMLHATSGLSLKSPLHSAKMVSEFADKHPDAIISILKSDPDLLDRISKLEHFSIKKYFFSVAEFLNKENYPDLFKMLQPTFPTEIDNISEVILNEVSLIPISYELSLLNDLELLNKSFAEKLNLQFNAAIAPLKFPAFNRSEEYLRRSFYQDTNPRLLHEQLLVHALNVAISTRVTQTKMEEVFNILNDEL